MTADVLGTGLAFPFSINAQRRVELARDETDVAQAIRIILATAPGERPMRPEFGCGIHALVFERMDAATLGEMERAIRAGLARWEPRIEVEKVTFRIGDGDGRLQVAIDYRLLATNSRRNLIYPFYLVPAGGH
jgi:phage baseplate assembly protein W